MHTDARPTTSRTLRLCLDDGNKPSSAESHMHSDDVLQESPSLLGMNPDGDLGVHEFRLAKAERQGTAGGHGSRVGEVRLPKVVPVGVPLER
eukprot:3042854-Prymnesium_polylepis.1